MPVILIRKRQWFNSLTVGQRQMFISGDSFMKRFLILTIIALLSFAVFADEKGDAVAKKHFDAKKADDLRSSATMTLIDKSGAQKVRKLDMYEKEGPEGKNAFTEFNEPADIKGTKFLVIAHKKTDDEQRLYLPAMQKVRKISSSDKSGKFVNSDLFFYDLEDREFGDYQYTYIKEDTFNGKPTDVVEMKPVDAKSPYLKAIAWVEKENSGIVKMETYDKKGMLWKTFTFTIEVIQGINIPKKTEINNVQENHKTVLELNAIKVNSGLKSDIFSMQNLEK
jgi:outer membrane lipoprotein-sorting protein